MDTKKYIIEIPDNTAWLQWVKVSDKDGHVCFDFKDPEDLTPYTEPNLEAIHKEAYDKGYQDATVKIGSNEQAIAEKAYQRGLNDAWDVVNKILELNTNARTEIFSCASFRNTIAMFSASEAIERLQAYEQKKEEIKVWDEVQHKSCNSIKIIVLNKEGDVITGIAIEDVPYACKVGEMYTNRNEKDWKKTGKHYDIAEVLRKMKEKEA